MVAGGNKQRDHTSKQEASSPTSHTEAVFSTATIEALEERDVAIIDLPNAFCQTDVVKDDKPVKIIMIIRGRLAELLCEIAPETYLKYAVRDRKGNLILYVRLLKALYGLMQASLMFYQKLLKDLESKGFVVNPYDPCVANKALNGEQFTIVWHVDDLKLSHKDPEVVTEMIAYLKGLYEKLPNGEVKLIEEQRLTDSNKVLNYLGMDFDFSVKKQVSISMKHYVEKVIEEFPDPLRNKVISTPATAKLYEVRNEAPKLDPEKKAKFHRIVAQLLYIVKRARPDLAPAVPFMTTRVSDPDDDDWRKLRHVIEYISSTKDMCLTLEADEDMNPTWSIDAAYGVHGDCKGQSGGSFTLGKGSIHTVSCKQKINTKSSTEAELVAIDDCIGHAIWLRHFLLAQGYKKAETIVILQDNQSAILLEQNGILSSTKRTKHLNVRYFFIKDKIDSGEIVVQWCPTDKMCSDYLTKPLCGEKFRHFRQKLMNLKPGKLYTLTPTVKEGKNPELEDTDEVNMGQVSSSLAERTIKKVRTNVRNRMASNMRRNINGIPLRDRIAKQMDRGMIYPTMNKGIKEWCRIDIDRQYYVSTWSNGPKYKDVISRTTYDMHSGRIINHLVFNEHTNPTVLHKKKLPEGVNWIKTVLLFKSDKN